VDAMETALNQYDFETCIICEKARANGIRICNQLICDSCQQEMVETGVDHDRYQFFIKRLGKLSVKLINEQEVSEGKCS
jgi:hypothetical protein